MTKFVKIKGNVQTNKISIITETGHIVEFKPNVNIFVDLEKEEDGHPFFFVEFPFQYIRTYKDKSKKQMSIKQIEKMATERSISDYWKTREFDSHF